MTITEALETQENFSDSEKEIADFILKEREKVLEMSAHDICDETYTSTSSIVRLCRKIGLDGFKEFKIKYAAELERRVDHMDDIDPDFPFEKNDTALDIAQKMDVLMVNNINASYDMMTKQAKELQKAAKLITRARRVLITGMGDSYLKAQVFQSNMIKIDRIVLLCNISGDQSSLADIMTPVDCAIVVSYSGNTRAVYEIVEVLRKRGVPMVAITSDPDSMIGKAASIILQMPKKEQAWDKQATFASQAATEYFLNVLYSYIYVMDYDANNKQRKHNISEYGDTRIKKEETHEPKH
ncbi:MAG: MurR/RpiR family transcriptional regulator [Erysipelotrichaceae bacterium]|nr:MurR/RpiR family transcriptional regulator [Erysipelotrichaceae bacterium]